MLLENSEKVHVVVRRAFETDLRRHFIGEIKEAEASMARIEGYFMVFDKSKNIFIKKPNLRVTIMDLACSTGTVCHVLWCCDVVGGQQACLLGARCRCPKRGIR